MLCVRVSFHHHRDKSPYKLECTDITDALRQTIECELGLILPEKFVFSRGPVTTVVCKEEGGGESASVFIWYNDYDDKINFGFGLGECEENLDRHDNVWLEMISYIPTDEEIAELEKLSKTEIIIRYLELKALQ